MKYISEKGWNSIIPLHLRGESGSHFCIFSKAKTSRCGPGNTPVYLNVYDLTTVNGCVYWAGVGIFHSGIQVHGVEYAFGAHDYPTSGVFEVEPRRCPGFKFRKSIFMGTTCLDPIQFREFMECNSADYNGDTYHLIGKNCNHFCEDICYKLTGKHIPKWVNRLARIGNSTNICRSRRFIFSFRLICCIYRQALLSLIYVLESFSTFFVVGYLCNCMLPKALKTSTVPHDSNFQGYDSEKKRLRTTFGCFTSISMHQREVSMSSLFLHSHYKGCLPPWELKGSKSRSMKER